MAHQFRLPRGRVSINKAFLYKRLYTIFPVTERNSAPPISWYGLPDYPKILVTTAGALGRIRASFERVLRAARRPNGQEDKGRNTRRGVPGKLSRSIWAEDLVREAINRVSRRVVAVRYGIAKTVPAAKEKRAAHTKFIRSMATHGKRPDLLLYRKAWLEGQDNETAKKIAQELEFTADEDCDPLIAPAILGIECETSMWNVRLMVAKGKSPTVVVKDVDLPELKSWADHFGKPVHFVQLFQDQAYYLSLADLLARVNDGRAVPEKQYRVPFKAFYIRPPAARLAGDLDPEAKIRARYSVGTDGRIRSHLEFHNARLVLAAEWLMALEEAAG